MAVWMASLSQLQGAVWLAVEPELAWASRENNSSFSSSEEKYSVLEHRDRLLREDRKRIAALDKTAALTGTCPDMCPEKERYLREAQSQLSPFEVLPGTDKVDHTAAIKEYSRSSKGLAELLPHELRPLPVLSMTMDYIITHIMDQGERNYQDWYSFVWNRTHGIRKDIIHQHLQDPQTVSLMEKCARFHIHCAHHLCEEPISTFDAPINKDQITKCLFTLKEMYLDLASESTSCRREAEFQAYAILLTLNQGDVLRQVQQLQSDIRNSPEVKFAIQVFMALTNNNYVKFFKLAQAASYLNACLLHCYFSQARGKALRTMTATHTVSAQKTTGFPLDCVVRWLLFNDSREAVSFLHHYGLRVSEGYVELNRRALREPKQPYKPKRSRFILEKLTTSVGEMVNGEPLPSVPQHIPENSFSPRGQYIGDRADMVITTCWKNTHVDTPVSPSGRRTEKRFLDPQESESAASPSLLPFIDLELHSIKWPHVFPKLGQSKKINENILQYEEEWKTEKRGQKGLGWKGEDESRKQDDEGGWFEIQEWEGEHSERHKGQNGDVIKDQGKEDRDECDKHGKRVKYGSDYVQENMKQEQRNEKGRTWTQQHKYDKIWEVPEEVHDNRIYLERYTREIKRGRKGGQGYEEELEVVDKRKVIEQSQGRKAGRFQERRKKQEQEQINQEWEKENSCEGQFQREQGRTHRGMQEGGSGDNIWERRDIIEEEVEIWWWNYRELGKGKRRQKYMEEEKEKIEKQGQKRKSSWEREHKYYKERYREEEADWERGHKCRKTRKDGNEKGHSHKKGGQNTLCMTRKYEEGKKNESCEEYQERKDGRGMEQCGVEKSGEKSERKAWKLNFKERKEGRHFIEEDREDDQVMYWKDGRRKGKNYYEQKEIRKLERENYKHLNLWGREKRKCLNEERVKWERQSVPREDQEQYNHRGEDDARGLKEATLGKESLKRLDKEKWRLERENRKERHEKSHEQRKKEAKRRKREVKGSNYEKEWEIEDGELVDENLEIEFGSRWSSDHSEKLQERTRKKYREDQDNKVRRKWAESVIERDYRKEHKCENGQELRHEDLRGENIKIIYPDREGKVAADEWERNYRKEKKLSHNNKNDREVEGNQWVAKAKGEKEDGHAKKESLELKKIPLKYLDDWKREIQEGLEDRSRERWGGQRLKRKERREHYEEEKYDRGVKIFSMGNEYERNLQEVNKEKPQRTECREGSSVDHGRNKNERKQGNDKGRHREAGKRKFGKMWGTGDQERLDKEVWVMRCKKDQGRDHRSEPSEEDWDNEHGVERKRDEESGSKVWGKKHREGLGEEESQAQEEQNTLEPKEKDQEIGISGVSEGQWGGVSEGQWGEALEENEQKMDGQDRDLQYQEKRKRRQDRENWEAQYGEDVKGDIGSNPCEGRQEEQPNGGENQKIQFGRYKKRETDTNQKEDWLEGDIRKGLEEEDGGSLGRDKGMNNKRYSIDYDWEGDWGKDDERTGAEEEPVWENWERLHKGELEGEVWARKSKKSLKHVGGGREEIKGRDCGLEQVGTIKNKGRSLWNRTYSKEIENERGKERKEETQNKLDYQKNNNGEKLEVSASPARTNWENDKSQESYGKKQEDCSREDGVLQREGQDTRERMVAQYWEGDFLQDDPGDGLEKWPADVSVSQRGKAQDDGESQGVNFKLNGEGGQGKLTVQPQEPLLRSGGEQQKDGSLGTEEHGIGTLENQEEAHSASHLSELTKSVEKLTPAGITGPGNGLNNEGAQRESSQRWMRLSRSRKENLPWELQESISMAAWAPLDLPSLVAECQQVPRQELFWKVLLILPGYDSCFACSPTRVLMDWLRIKFMGTKGPTQNEAGWSDGRVETLCALKSQRQKWSLTLDINICVKALHGVYTKEQFHKSQTQDSLFALSGLILLLPTRRRGVCQDGYWHLARLQLSQLLRTKPPQLLVPLVILVPADSETLEEEEAKAGLRLRDLIISHLISYFTILRIPCYIQDLEGSYQVQEAVRWLVYFSPPAAELCRETFTHFMEKGINCEFGERLSRDWKARQLVGLPSQEPGIILELYNSVIQFLAGVMSAKELCGPSGLAPEFFQLNNQRYLQPQGSMQGYLEWLRSIALDLQLPPIVLPQKTNWQCMCSSILTYIHGLFGAHPSYPLLHCQVEHLLSQAYCHWWTKDSREQREPSGLAVPWDVIICLCVQQLLQTWSPPRQPGSPEAGEHEAREIQVCYFKDSLREYCLPVSWENPRLKTVGEMLQHEKEQAL